MKRSVFAVIVFFLACCAGSVPARADHEPGVVREDLASLGIEELTRRAWAASSKGDPAELEAVATAARHNYEQEAMAEHVNLTAFPPVDQADKYKVLNNYATILFVRAEAFMHQGRNEEALAAFEQNIRNFPYAQCWDPSRGSFWSTAEKSRDSINVIKGVETPQAPEVQVKPLTKPWLATPGTDKVIDYAKYGAFSGLGTKDYKYTVSNPNVLGRAIGEGIFPNTGDILRNPRYKDVYKEGRLLGLHWDFVQTNDLEAAYFKWAMAPEDPGVKLFYLAIVFEKAGMWLEAIKTYHSLIVHFPKTVGRTYWHTPWYPAQAAVAKIRNILRMHPELGLEYVDAKVHVLNSADNSTENDVFLVNPGVIRERSATASLKKAKPLEQVLGKVKRQLGGAKTRFVQYENGHWRMFVDGRPFIIKGLTYMPTKVGQSPDKNTVANWMYEDNNGNGLPDGPYDAWVDRNRNNIQDADEPVVGDFQLMQDMGVNTLRYYHNNNKVNKELLREMYDRHGIMVLMGDFLGKYTLGSGADWSTGTDYENPVHRANMLASVEAMVREFKDEPYIVMWLLGNENNYGVASNADKKPEVYYKFVNEIAKRIKELDPSRPVALCNGDTLFLDKMAVLAPNVDAYGANVYRGDYGFGAFWSDVHQTADRPAFITEYGAPAHSNFVPADEAEDQQAAWHKSCWLDIEDNRAGNPDGEGNAVGGVAFEWLDEWWKNYEPAKHDTKADVIGPFAGGYYFEEWFGLIGQGDGKNSPFLRQPRKAYFVYEDLWNKKKKK